MAALNGPVLLPDGGKKPQQVFVFLHGYGADGNDLIGLAPYIRDLLPNAVFLSPNAPFPCDMSPFGYQWFPIATLAREELGQGVEHAAPILDKYLDDVLSEYGLTNADLILFGFSQGAMMALRMALVERDNMAGVIACSGAAAGVEKGDIRPGIKTPILLLHGDIDNVVIPDYFHQTTAFLDNANVGYEGHLIPGLPHGINDAAIMHTRNFIKHFHGVLNP